MDGAAAKTHIPTCRELKGLCRATEVPTNGDEPAACVSHFEQLSQEFDKENAAHIANALQHAAMLSSKDLEVEVLNTLCCQPASGLAPPWHIFELRVSGGRRPS